MYASKIPPGGHRFNVCACDVKGGGLGMGPATPSSKHLKNDTITKCKIQKKQQILACSLFNH